MLLQQVVQQVAPPLLTNDVFGLLKLLVAIVLGMSPVYGLTIWFLRRGPEVAIADMQRDLNGFGDRVQRVELAQAAEAQSMGQLEIAMARSQQDRETLHVGGARMEARMESVERRIDSHQRELLEAVHKVELQVATLVTTANVAGVLADKLEKIAQIMVQREGDSRRER